MKYEPNFDCINGAISGYDTEDFSANRRNREALAQRLSDQLIDEDCAPENWDEAIRRLENYLGFWKRMYCGIEEMADWEKPAK